jgi:NADPH-dependent curcumin reductase CurA
LVAVGVPSPGDWQHVEEPACAPASGEFSVEVLYISIDSAMRGWMDDVRSYLPPVAIGEVMRATALGRVVSS